MSKSPVVEKSIPVTYDLGNLAVADSNPIELKTETIEEQLYDLNRDNVQLLVNQLLQLPLKRTVDSANSSSTQDNSVTLLTLPEPLWQTPREKPVPKDKGKTRWELFAEKKGIKKRGKEGRLVYDEDSKTWVPKWGYKGINKKSEDQWLVEYDDKPKKGNDDLVDPRSLSRDERKKLVKKSALQHKRNAKANGF